MDQDKAPKAHWDALSTRIFCEMCKEQKRAGNRPTAFLSSEGYKCLGREFALRTGRNYTKIQFKNIGCNQIIVPSMGVLQYQSNWTWLGSGEQNIYSR